MTTNESLYPSCISDSFRGIYAPQHFAKYVDRANMPAEDWDILLAGPAADGYWDVWDFVAMNWEQDGITILESHGDIFLVDTNAPLGEWDYLLS